MTHIDVEVDGFEQVEEKMGQVSVDLTGDPMKSAMGTATLIVLRDAQKNAPVDRDQLRASITPEVRTTSNAVQGIVGSNKKYAPPQELGTRPFTPPWTPIYQWALRKMKGDKKAAGALAVGARRSIAARGIRAKRFLQRAVENNSEKIFRLLGNAVSTIVRK